MAWILNRLDHGVFLVGADARVAFANRAAENLLQAQRGLRLCGGVLKTDRAGETRALHDAIVTCTRTGDALDCHGFLVVTRGHGTPPLSCCVLRLPDARRDATPFGPVALLLFADPSGLPLPSARQLQTCFGLTAAEAALAVEVLVGDGLQACAKRLGISHTTARTHLGHIFEKTGTKRQAELVRVLLGVRAGIRLP